VVKFFIIEDGDRGNQLTLIDRKITKEKKTKRDGRTKVRRNHQTTSGGN